jgi:hypothetical protein
MDSALPRSILRASPGGLGARFQALTRCSRIMDEERASTGMIHPHGKGAAGARGTVKMIGRVSRVGFRRLGTRQGLINTASWNSPGERRIEPPWHGSSKLPVERERRTC